MFIRREANFLPKHVEYYTFKKLEGPITEEDKKEIEDFYKKHNIKYRGLTDTHRCVIFKRTTNYIYIVAHLYDKKYKNDKVGVVRTQAYVFHKSGRLLYELDHDYREHPKDTFGHSQTKHQKCLKLNYDLHDELNSKELGVIGRHCTSFSGFDRACHELLEKDDTPQSIDFIIS